MYIQKSIIGNNGIVTTHHGLIDAIVSGDLSHVSIRFQSWPDEAARLAGMASVDRVNVGIETESLDLEDGLAAAITAAVLASEDFTGGTVVADASDTLEGARDRKWAAIKAERDAWESGTFEVLDKTFDVDLVKLTGAALDAVLAKQQEEAYEQPWVLADNSVTLLSADDQIAVGRACKAYVSGLWAITQQLREDIESATTVEEVAAIVWP